MRLQISLLLVWLGIAQGAYQPAEKLGRGLVAVRSGPREVFLSWRLLADDPPGTGFLVLRFTGGDPGVLLTPRPLTGGTFYVDREADLTQDNYFVVVPVVRDSARGEIGCFFLPADSPVRQYFSIPLIPPEPGTTPDGERYTYSANDASVAEVDGDGEYEIILKWEPSNAKDNAQAGYTGNVYLDAYRLDGNRLWRIDLGPNIRAGPHYTQFIAYDLDGDGRAEVAVKTAPGTRDARGVFIGTRPERFQGPLPSFDPTADHRNRSGYVLTGLEFFTIFDGLTGEELVTSYYEPPRNNDPSSPDVSAWGDNYGNRVDRFLAAVAYLDGERPSLVLCRGYYTRTVLVAWNWRDGRLTKVWTFDSDDGTPGNAAYRGQGNHNLSVADVDGDGRDEIVYGAAVIDDNGKGLYSTGRGHGDALHVSDMAPSRPGLEIFQPHETPALYGYYALDLRDARTGEPICGVEGTGDIGRGIALDIDPRYPGFEFWGSGPTGGLYNAENCYPDPVKGPRARQISASKPRQINFGIWWDGDLLRELLDGTTISKWDWQTETTRVLFDPPGVVSINGTKANPCLSADILGDWREEVIWPTADSRELRIYTTTIPTPYRLPSLMYDRQYRLAVAWQNVGYNQPPHLSFALTEPSVR
ncbi:MAG: rhamnogalacturonan lyase [Bryobacterales bacterium]|nr:rhamnogalacturonan lyase [Bryobacterales bacterium]